MKNAVVLLSGGLDSSTTLALAKERGYAPYCMSFDYGQKQLIELKSARKVKNSIAPEAGHKIVKIDLKTFGNSAITDNIDVPKNRSEKEILSKIPITYVPARNTIFLSYALAYAEVLQANDIFIGANILDYSGYPDCRPAYIEAFNIMANLATSRAVGGEKIKIHAPLIQLNKAQIIEEGLRLEIDYSMTLSCYNPDENGYSCGECDACILRLQAFKELGKDDPIKYISHK
ncbi:7-cyano-7-deazaguanine synthase QueC [Rickettsiales endosymbiont of Trichoplax sp. H2]|uniref:7-cyano-7-deazaguanine synthase QueC n=1 Tax=Rickettsiales endosymbiont of Trichoplax sp. H2 TaxID=2021221 RepID=UPI0012B195F4|nr:7-cyano-7-deazaguanine synthase QueC [Rickettsiales endosymbiont of Trichoplax sp. H2]MSO13692.1 7-cyano-7-deazaguanine synthase [Rickettsiales endosymbiont of Trichoplax sp. H2]